ncbi:MAG: helicase-associated domain-containing protein [Treponema sp.]|nr:helicase-associated domain-containing protein [Treponema sp.]
MSITPKAQRIIDWRESFTKMPDLQFFDIIRMYLGEVKTPYNKQNLLEELSSFLRKEENQLSFVRLLCNIDLKLLAAVRYIPHVSQDKLESYCCSMFGGRFSKLSLSEHLANLMQRLLVYEFTNSEDGKKELRLNPVLEEALLPLLPVELLLPPPSVKIERKYDQAKLNPNFLGSFISYIFMHSDLCKADGSIKKRNASELSDIFGYSDIAVFELLIKAFCNLNLIHQAEKNIDVDWKRLSAFSELPEMYQYAYLCASSCGHFSRTTMHANAQLLYDTLNAVPYGGYERQSVINLSFLIKENSSNDSIGKGGRFAQLMARAEGSSSDMTTELVMESMIDACVEFGLLRSYASDSAEVLYVPDSILKRKMSETVGKNLLSIDAGYVVTVLPGLTLYEYLPLIKFLSIRHYDTALEFEISKRSVMKSFDAGMTPSLIEEQLQAYSSYPVPQNIRVSLEDWNNSYSSASLYHGYVLKVSKENITKTLNDRMLSRYIVAEIAEGVFLLNFANDEEGLNVIEKSSLDFIGKINEPENNSEILSLMPLKKSSVSVFDGSGSISSAPYRLSSSLEQNKIIDELKKQVMQMDIPLEQKEGLLDRIERRIVVNPEQLRGSSVRFECIEVGGMNYQGKIHLIEDSIQSKGLLEIRLEDEDSFMGMPVQLLKHENDADVEITFEDKSSRIVTVGKISYLKKIKKSLSFD